MEDMAKFLTELETFGEIEVSIIRQTKIQKVLKAIIKLPSIPKEEQYHFKQRAIDILTSWKNLLDSDVPTPAPADKDAKPESNGVNEEPEEAASASEPKAEADVEAESKADTKEGVKEKEETEDKEMTDAAAEDSKEKPAEVESVAA